MTPMTEDEIVHYLANTPEFFERHALVLDTFGDARAAVAKKFRDMADMAGDRHKIVSKEEFDKLPKGARYVNPADGKTYVVKQAECRWAEQPYSGPCEEEGT